MSFSNGGRGLGAVLVLLLAFGFAFQACQKETDCIYQDKRLCDPDYVPPPPSGFVYFDGVPENYLRRHLLEEFTGFLCINCPTATAVADQMDTLYDGRLSVVAIHCSQFYAAPTQSNPALPFHTDFRTTDGENLYEYFAPEGLPDGVINRLGTENSETISYQNWPDRLSVLMADSVPEVYLGFQRVDIDTALNVLSADVVVKPLKVDSNESYFINMGLVEDGIVEGQKAPGNQTIEEYTHNHVFRGNSNGTWGRPAYTAGDLPGDELAFLMNFTIELQPEWVIENSEIFVYVYRNSNKEIVQVEELHLAP